MNPRVFDICVNELCSFFHFFQSSWFSSKFSDETDICSSNFELSDNIDLCNEWRLNWEDFFDSNTSVSLFSYSDSFFDSCFSRCLDNKTSEFLDSFFVSFFDDLVNFDFHSSSESWNFFEFSLNCVDEFSIHSNNKN